MHEFFNQVWQMLIASNLLNIIGAVLILLIGWLVALFISQRVSGALQRLTKHPPALPDGTSIPEIKHGDSLLGKIVFWLIMVFTILACFSCLKMNEVTNPLQNFISPITNYSAHLIGAVLL